MHQLALALHRKGIHVTGSDDLIQDPARSALAEAGILPPEEGWFPERIQAHTDAVILGMHAKPDNPELARARAMKIPVYSFPEFIYQWSKEKTRVVVAGSHGKTTVTSMIMHILQSQGMDFDYLVGARVPGFPHAVQLTDAPLIILEGDEYLSSCEDPRPKMHWYRPHVTAITGIAWDHINVFPTYDSYLKAFRDYLDALDQGSRLFYFGEDPVLRALVEASQPSAQTEPYFVPSHTIVDRRHVLKTPQGEHSLSVMGRHNMANVEAAVSVAEALGLDRGDAYAALSDFQGAARRLEHLMEEPGLTLIRDFAHAPSKLKASLAAARAAYKDHYLLACYEMHTYSSLSPAFLDQYAGSMKEADLGLVYFSPKAVRHKGLAPIDPQDVAMAFSLPPSQVLNQKERLMEAVFEAAKKQDKPLCLLVMSSGTFDGIDWNNVSSQLKTLITHYG